MISNINIYTSDADTPPYVKADIQRLWRHFYLGSSEHYEWFGENQTEQTLYPYLFKYLNKLGLNYCFIKNGDYDG